jgi:double zinc ribbon protein
MTCPRCQAENRNGARFCRDCGAAFGTVCPGCGAKIEGGGRFCDSCGAPLGVALAPASLPARFGSPESYAPKHIAEKILTSRSALEGERKQVTVLFADLKGSLELLADRDPEEVRKLLDPVLERMMEAVHRYEGTVNQVMGAGSWRSSARPWPTRTTPSARVTPRSTCRPRCGGTLRRSDALTG